ncbi:MAG: hypothetical protein R3F55_07930 [Alphaproteobacteria bacterium]
MADRADAVTPAAELVALVDALVPGDGAFPPASAVGAQARLVERLDRLVGDGAIGRVVEALAAAGGPLHMLSGRQRAAVLQAVQAAQPDLFAAVLKAVYLGYYESPLVHAAIRALGHPYNTRLLPGGYAVAPFDPAIDAPSHRRGRCLATADVARVDLAGLALSGRGTANDG